MTTDDQTVRLLDAAVPPIPAEFRIPPYERIRGRAVRRRAATLATTALAVALLAVGALGAVIATERPRPHGSTVVGGAATTPPIVLARVDRAGTGVTLYMNPPGECTVYGEPSTGAVEENTTVRVILRAVPVPVDCSRSMVSTASLTLSRPLGSRRLVDNASGRAVPVFPDANLPIVPPPWTEVHTDFTELDGTTFDTPYTRPGGPDLHFMESVGGGLDPSPVEHVQLGHHQGVIVHLTNLYEVDWLVGELLYQLQLEPTEGTSLSLDQVHQVISQLTWD